MTQKRKKRKKTHPSSMSGDLNNFMDEIFAFIAGYTPGGAPYGVTWEEIGIDPDLPFDEKVRLYDEQVQQDINGINP